MSGRASFELGSSLARLFDDLIERHIRAGTDTATGLLMRYDEKTWPEGKRGPDRVLDGALQRLRKAGRIEWNQTRRKWSIVSDADRLRAIEQAGKARAAARIAKLAGRSADG